MPDNLNDTAIRDFFFEGPMEQFLVLMEGVTPARKTRGARLTRIHAEKTMVKCADSITSYIKKLADDTKTAVALAHLELYNVPIDLLPTWITRLGTLKSLRIRDGSILGAEAGSAISQCCPYFDDLTLYWLEGPTVDEDLAAFFSTLRPNSLRSFEVMSQNRIGENSLTALNAHAASLKSLKLGTLSAQAMKCLNVLPSCNGLEVLEIENEGGSQVDLRAFSEGMLKEVTAWIRSCKSLRELSFRGVQDALLIVKDVLSSPDIRLNSLDIQFFRQFNDQDSATTWATLGLQDSLESFTLGAKFDQQDMFVLAGYPSLVDSICRLKNLKSLNLKQIFAQAQEIHQFARSLPNLVDFSFGGEVMDDCVLESLAALPHLMMVGISAQSLFTWPGLQNFAQQLELAGRYGFQLEILGQLGEAKFAEEQQNWLQDFFANKLHGRFDIGYHMDPDELHELHEDDFSDLSD
ncbi:hypothetical protein DL770_007079 [Monosporascus sp. CRB-9-2]|nr:hypothetical protein DL770_007079 [Monosporascus sp. CRB-9-2]